jgi:LPS sulfotransferase NodH
MRLAPGAKVPEHADASYHWHNRVRLHIPVFTRPEVRFHCDGQTVHMAAGEAWLFDNWRRHSVDNDGPEERIHLVADTTGTAAFWQFVGASPDATSDRTIPWQPGVEARLATEQTVPRPVMAPPEVELLVTDFIGELVAAPGMPEAAQQIGRYVGLLNGFCFDWRQLYLLHGENPAAESQYQSVLQSLRAATQPIAHGLVMATNHSPAQAVLESRLLQHVLRFDDVAATARPSQPAVNARHAVGPAATALQPRRPVFIVAAPRSGSTLLFETLAVSPQFCTVGGEAHWLVEQLPQLRPGAPGVESNRLLAAHVTPEVRQRILATLWPRMVDASRRALDPREAASLRWLEKTPKNSLRIPFLERLFPDAAFVYLWRDPHENIASIIEAWRAGGWVTYPELEGWDGPWSMIVPPGYPSMRGRPLEDVATFQWERTNATILDDLAARPRDRWTAVSYAELLRDPAMVVRGICEFAGVEYDAALAARVAGPLPASRHTHTEPAPDKWRRHEAAILARRAGFESTWQRLQALPTLTGRNGT